MIVLIILVLASCSSIRVDSDHISSNNSPIDFETHVRKIEKIKDWSISGKLAIITPEDRVNLYLNWRHSPQNSQFKLNNLLGISVATITQEGEKVTMVADGETYENDSIDDLIASVTGLVLPISSLVNWLKGLPGKSDRTTFNQRGLLETLTPSNLQLGSEWQISFENYRRIDGTFLPHRLRLMEKNRDINVIISVSKWRVN